MPSQGLPCPVQDAAPSGAGSAVQVDGGPHPTPVAWNSKGDTSSGMENVAAVDVPVNRGDVDAPLEGDLDEAAGNAFPMHGLRVDASVVQMREEGASRVTYRRQLVTRVHLPTDRDGGAAFSDVSEVAEGLIRVSDDDSIAQERIVVLCGLGYVPAAVIGSVVADFDDAACCWRADGQTEAEMVFVVDTVATMVATVVINRDQVVCIPHRVALNALVANPGLRVGPTPMMREMIVPVPNPHPTSQRQQHPADSHRRTGAPRSIEADESPADSVAATRTATTGGSKGANSTGLKMVGSGGV